jgi:starch-binding outer membrane protein, SusD/RagB family
MKKIFSSLFLTASLMLLFTACKKSYLETIPTSSTSTATVFATTANAMAALNGIHRDLYVQYSGSQDQGGLGSVMINLDMLGEDLVMTTAGNGWFNATYQWLAHRNVNSTTDYYMYSYFYQVIGNANQIINNIDKAVGPDAEKKWIKGQAETYRAFCYFNLVQLFGKRYDASTKPNSQLAVPLVLSFTAEGQPRATVEDVYAQINKDLSDAITNLTGYNRNGDKSQLDISVAKGIKARVALTMQDWATAAQLASEARNGYSLMSPAQYLQGFSDVTNPEWMWGSHQISDQSTYFYSFFAFMSANFNSTNIRTNPKAINSTLYDKISATDVRKQLWDPTGTNTNFPVPPSGVRKPYMNRKFLAASSSNSIGDVAYMRTAEMYLVEAEARARAGQDPLAQELLYTLVKSRDPNYAKSTSTGAALINEILVQRRIELWGEGFRFYDLKRLNQPLDRTNSNHQATLANVLTIPAGDARWEFLIPQIEINANPAIVQNP